MDKRHLKKLLNYQNPHLIKRFSLTYGIHPKTSKVIFQDMLRFLWVAQRAKYLEHVKQKPNIPPIYIFDANTIIDEMWHMFILGTMDYTDFCNKYFGHYLHHEQTSMEEVLFKKSDQELDTFENELSAMMEFIYIELGEKVAKRWFLEYPEKFPKQKIRELHLANFRAA